MSGSLGEQFVICKGRAGNTVVSNRPTFSPDRQFNATQLAHREAFKQAIAYAKTAKQEELYITKAQGTTMNAFNAAVADWFNKPQVLEIDTAGWDGSIGGIIRVKAMDDPRVNRVHVEIRDGDGNIFEQGEASPADGLWWSYTTSAAVPMQSTPFVNVTVHDRPAILPSWRGRISENSEVGAFPLHIDSINPHSIPVSPH